MDDRHRRFDGVLDRHAGAPQLAKVLRPDGHAGRLGVHDRVEGAAERHVGAYLPGAESHRHRRVEDERRHVDEADPLDARPIAIAADLGPRPDLPRRRVEHDHTAAAARDDQPALDGHRDDGDDAVAAHRAVAFVVHEEHAGIRIRTFRLGQQRAVHVRVPARLEHQRRAQVVAVGPHPLAPLEHRRALDARKAVHDESERFAGGVCVDGAEGDHGWGVGSGLRAQGSGKTFDHTLEDLA